MSEHRRVLPWAPFWQQSLFQLTCCSVVAVAVQSAVAQQAVNPAGNLPNVFVPNNGPAQNGPLNAPNANAPARLGASANADFESLIDLIQATVATETWADNGGGEADIRPFPGGVFVDAAGTLRLRSVDSNSRQLAEKRGVAPIESALTPLGTATTVEAARKASSLRFVSLPRLEREIIRRQKAHKPLDPDMLTLAGMQRVQYVFVYPDSGDLVLAGPAGDWRIEHGRIVSTDTGHPVVRLDDLLVLLRRGDGDASSHFGCSINPRQEALAKTQAFLAASGQKPVAPGGRKKWLSELRDTVGKQDIEIFGIDPTSRVAQVLVEADYHMKLIGMGLADGVDGVESYLDSIPTRQGANSLPPMSVLRWWFTPHYQSIGVSADHNAFELVGQGVCVLSENELLAGQGKRVHTGQSDPLNQQFADNFTAHFNELADKYPIYSELRNIFDLAMAVAMIQDESLLMRVGWTPTLFAHRDQLQLPRAQAPRQVETVVNHRLISKRQFVAGVSGGVMVAPADVLREARGHKSDVKVVQPGLAVQDGSRRWWWDASETASR
jgi:hypothetical protein